MASTLMRMQNHKAPQDGGDQHPADSMAPRYILSKVLELQGWSWLAIADDQERGQAGKYTAIPPPLYSSLLPTARPLALLFLSTLIMTLL